MEKYKNLAGASGVDSYEIGDNFVRVMFSDRAVYLYTYQSAGEHLINQMKKLAVTGRGLNAFINTKVNKKYSKKEQ